jgi:predicted nucleotidyltransferase
MAKSFPKKIKKILAETKGQLSFLYAHRLKEIILFGSYARGDYTRGSDIDLLLLLDGVDDPDVERKRYARTICDLSLKYDTVVSVIPMDYKRYLSRKTPLILNARREGMRI